MVHLPADQSLETIVWPIQKTLAVAELATAIRYLAGEVLSTDVLRDQQSSALRDAGCIAVAVWRGIGFERAATLTREVGQALMHDWTQRCASGDERDVIVDQFAEWMMLYLNGVRPRFHRRAQPSPALFLTRFGAPYKGFGVAAHFAQALRQAGVTYWRHRARLLVGTALPAALRTDRERSQSSIPTHGC